MKEALKLLGNVDRAIEVMALASVVRERYPDAEKRRELEAEYKRLYHAHGAAIEAHRARLEAHEAGETFEAVREASRARDAFDALHAELVRYLRQSAKFTGKKEF